MKRVLGCLAMAVCLFSCSDFDLLRSEIDALSEKLQKIEQNCEKINRDLQTLAVTVEALQKEDMVTSVSPVTAADGTVEAYIINFLNSGLVTIYNGGPGDKGDQGEPGKDGADGPAGNDGADASAPVVAVRKDADGRYYWTSDGEWILDEDGRKIEVDRGGRAPQMKVEGNSWYVSYDGGKAWNYLADYSPDSEGYVFSEVDNSNPDYVRIVLADGTVLDLPKYKAVTISLKTETEVASGGTAVLEYKVENASSVSVSVDDSDVQSAVVSASDAVSGTITINLKSTVSPVKQRLFVIFKIDGDQDDWWLVTFDNAGKVVVSDIR